MKKKQTPYIEKSKVIVDSRDGSKDRFIPTAIARKLYEELKLAIDVTNSVRERVYCDIGDNSWKQHIIK